MANSYFCLRSSKYKNHVFKGFAQLQQSDEFVDMTLAAGDQYVKVHKTLIVLASPYLKALLQAIPCQHPVLFLSNVKAEDLHYILEYIYTGEVNIPAEKLKSFLTTAQAMHISGLATIEIPAGNDTNDKQREGKQATQVIPAPVQLYRSTETFPAVKANITINENATHIPNIQNGTENMYPLLDINNEPAPEENVLNARIGPNISINLGNDDDNANNSMNKVDITNNLINSEKIDLVPIAIDEMPQNLQRPFLNIGKAAFTITGTAFNNSRSNITVDSSSPNPTSFDNLINIASKPSTAENDAPRNNINNLDCGDIASLRTTDINAVNQEQVNEADGARKEDSMLYTISSRGSLQLIMNRFMYYCHYTRDGGRKRRWRCIEYRNLHCPAAIDTDGETIVARKQKHAHPNHDKKIWNKVVKSRVFPSLRMAQETVKEKQSLPKPVAEELVISD